MRLHVVCFCSYLAEVDVPWRPQDWDANKFVHAVKGHQLNAYAKVPVLGSVRRLSNANLDSAIEWFAEMVASYLARKKVAAPIGLIPVPNSKSTLSSPSKPHTLKLARAIAGRMGDGTEVRDCLRWKKNLGSASSGGGPREAGVLYQNCAVTNKPDRDIAYILVDDVLTSGGHLQACASRLREAGARILMAICAGRTVYVQPRNAFSIIEENLADFTPP